MAVILTDKDTTARTFILAGFVAGGVKLIDQASSAASYIRTLLVRHTEATSKAPKARRNLRQEVSKVVSGVTHVASVDLTVSYDPTQWTADEIEDLITSTPTYFTDEASVGFFMSGGIRQ